MSTKVLSARSARSEFESLVKARAVGAVFQPIVDLDTEEPVGYEALARGPASSMYAEPTALFEQAYRAGQVAELDWVCRAAAVSQAMAAGLPSSMPLFVNVEPPSLGSPCPADVLPVLTTAENQLRLVLEVTERSLSHDPAALLAAVAEAREHSLGVALDDVGADPASLALLPLICPDVIKLDLSLIQARPTPAVARIVNAVQAEAERCGTTVVAEGVENRRHIDVARSMGATLGQGWYFGRPGPLPRLFRPPRHELTLQPARTASDRTPFEIVADRRRVSRTTKDLLIPMSRHLEYKIFDSVEPAVVLACFQDVRFFGEATRARYSHLASRGVMTAAFGEGMPPAPGLSIRGGPLQPDDPLTNEWIVIVIGPHFAAALVARDCGDQGTDQQRRLDFVITHDRELVIEAAKPVLTRLLPATP
jgi:EAL domain-containing protein (putative c-di-GMP-specific phosphodiesterase class I)